MEICTGCLGAWRRPERAGQRSLSEASHCLGVLNSVLIVVLKVQCRGNVLNPGQTGKMSLLHRSG